MFSSESNELMFEKAGRTRGHYGGMMGLIIGYPTQKYGSVTQLQI